MILCSQFAPNVWSNKRISRYQQLWYPATCASSDVAAPRSDSHYSRHGRVSRRRDRHPLRNVILRVRPAPMTAGQTWHAQDQPHLLLGICEVFLIHTGPATRTEVDNLLHERGITGGA
jgi:hypothetical protein